MDIYWQELYLAHSETRGYKKRITQAKDIINRFVDNCASPYISFSGGKDSTVLLGLFRDLGFTDVKVFSQLDDFDWSFTRSHIESVIQFLGFKNHYFREPRYSVLGRFCEMNFINTEIEIDTQKCFFDEIDSFILEHGLTGNANGIRAEESKKRRYCTLKSNLLYQQLNGFWKCFPLGFLNGYDVFAYIVSNNIPYAKNYDLHCNFAPHEVRFSWILHPDFLQFGQAVWLKTNFPDEYNRLSKLNPKIRCYV